MVPDTSPTVPRSRGYSNDFYVLTYSSQDSATSTATCDPWQQTQTTASSGSTYVAYSRPQAEVDYAALLRESRRAASMVPPPRENRARTKLHVRARRGFQQMCRLPCYRGSRTR